MKEFDAEKFPLSLNDQYRGQLDDGEQRDGWGRLELKVSEGESDGGWYVGQWRRDLRHGIGIAEAEGDRYTGEWRFDLQQ